MLNERLRAAPLQKRITIAALAEKVGVVHESFERVWDAAKPLVPEA